MVQFVVHRLGSACGVVSSFYAPRLWPSVDHKKRGTHACGNRAGNEVAMIPIRLLRMHAGIDDEHADA